jgi:hypothetical protein
MPHDLLHNARRLTRLQQESTSRRAQGMEIEFPAVAVHDRNPGRGHVTTQGPPVAWHSARQYGLTLRRAHRTEGPQDLRRLRNQRDRSVFAVLRVDSSHPQIGLRRFQMNIPPDQRIQFSPPEARSQRQDVDQLPPRWRHLQEPPRLLERQGAPLEGFPAPFVDQFHRVQKRQPWQPITLAHPFQQSAQAFQVFVERLG